ncbi:MAG: 3'-5' exonuclease [Campylobacterales bacterium]|nr:3'-5' exonuclease [Campylobacterales bacterium]
MAKFVLLDTETTGSLEQDRIIQLGFMVLENAHAPQVYQSFCSMPQPISFGAMAVHHITPEMIEGCPPLIECEAYQTLQTLNTPENVMVIQNAPFDLGMLRKEGFTCTMKLIDTLRCAKHLFEDHETHALQYMRYALGLYKTEEEEAKALGIEIKAHDAIGDVLTLKLFLGELRKRVSERFGRIDVVEKLIELTKTPIEIKTFRFGKYKGRLIADVAREDAGYLRWMQGNMELDEDMRYTLGRVL